MFNVKNIIKNKTRNRWKINFCSHCIGCGFKMFEAIGEEELSYLLKGLI